jgi:hypothetical protein
MSQRVKGEGGQQKACRRFQGDVVGAIARPGHRAQGRHAPAAGIGVAPRVEAG